MPVIRASKERDVTNGKITGTSINVESLKGLPCYIVDDICDGGRTFVELAKILKEKNCGDIYLYVSHGIFSNGTDGLVKNIKQICTTNFFSSEHEAERLGIDIIKLRKDSCYDQF